MKRLIGITVLIIVVSLFVNLRAQDFNELFQKANQAYRAQAFDEAIELYMNILSEGYHSNEIYFNLGNCYFRLNRIGEAILYYEKALKIDPQDNDIQYNLELANLRVIDRIELPPKFILFQWWDKLQLFFSIDQLTKLIVLFFFAAIISLILWFFVKRYRVRRWFLTFSALLGFFTIFWAYILIVRVKEYNNLRQAIILSYTVTVMSAPDENSTDVFLLHEGVKVRLDEQRGEWVKISLPDGKSGWLKSDNLGII